MKKRSPSFAGLILAAGESSRMGRDKALLPWRGATFLSAAINALEPHCDLVIIVGGKNAASLQPVTYSAGVFLVVNSAPERGQFSSLQVGLQHVLERGRDAALVALVDRPPARSQTIAAIRDRFCEVCAQGLWAVVPEYGGQHGHPVAIGREMIERFLKAPVNSTARDIEHSVQAKIEYLPVDDPAICANVDTPEDFESLTRSAGKL